MSALSGIVTLLFFTVVGDTLSRALNLPVPGSVLGLILLVIYLQRGANESLEKVSRFCIRYLAVLFIPGCVGIFFLGDLLLEQWLPIILAILIATPLSLLLTALLLQWLLKRFGKSLPAQKQTSEGRDHG